ncbi:MAG: thiol peroxidase [Planctomycetota bacterium]
MSEHEGVITFKGGPLTLLGDAPTAGSAAPDFTLAANDLSAKSLSDYAGKTVILSVVPSLDTPVCDTQTRKFNEEAAGLSDNTVVLTVSVDLPMAQARWCGAAGVERVETLSDYKDHGFGVAYGVRIKELGLLTRAVFVIDGGGQVTYSQIVPEVTDEPDYAAALEAAKAIA